MQKININKWAQVAVTIIALFFLPEFVILYSGGETYLIHRSEIIEAAGKLFIILAALWYIATVIGAGSFSLSVSGSTCYFDKSILFPLENIPVINVNIRKESYSPEKLLKEMGNAFRRFDMKEGEDLVALYFKDPIYRNNFYLTDFAKAIEEALPNSIANNKMVILIFDQDMGGSLGIALRRDTALQTNLICMDELELEEGDWIDIGAPLYSGQAFPVTVKSLVFNKNKNTS